MKQTNSQLIQKPPGLSSPAPKNEPGIFSMPAAYRHGTAPKMTAPVAETLATVPVSVQPVVKEALQKPEAFPKIPQRVSRFRLVVFTALAIIIIGLGSAGYIIWQGFKQPLTVTPVVIPVPSSSSVPSVTSAPSAPSQPSAPSAPSEPFPEVGVPGTDTDSDGLTDLEESLIYQTNPRLPDTDRDGFLDGNEVFHLYNPNGDAPGTLLAAGLVKQTATALVSFYYPAVWSAQTQTAEPSLIINATTGEMMTVSVMPKETPLALDAYLASQPTDTKFLPVRTKGGVEAFVTENKRTVYFDGGDSFIVLSYELGIKGQVDYLQTFEMMQNSLQIKK